VLGYAKGLAVGLKKIKLGGKPGTSKGTVRERRGEDWGMRDQGYLPDRTLGVSRRCQKGGGGELAAREEERKRANLRNSTGKYFQIGDNSWEGFITYSTRVQSP